MLLYRFNFWFLLCISVFAFSIISLFCPETLPALLVNRKHKNLTPIRRVIDSWKCYYTNTSNHHNTDEKWQTQKQQDSSNNDNNNNNVSNRTFSLEYFTLAFQNLTKVHIVMNLLLSGLYNAVQDCYNITTAQLLTERFKLDPQMVGLCYLPQSIGGIIGGLSTGVYLRYWFKKAVHQYNTRKINNDTASEEENQNKKNNILVIDDESKILPYDFPICKARLVPVWINGILVQLATALYGWCYVWSAPLPVLLCLQFIGNYKELRWFLLFTLAFFFLILNNYIKSGDQYSNCGFSNKYIDDGFPAKTGGIR